MTLPTTPPLLPPKAETTERPPMRDFIQQLRRWMHPHKKYAAGAAIALVCASCSVLALGGVVRHLVDHGLGPLAERELHHTLMLFMLTISALAVSSAGRFYFTAILGKSILSQLRIDLFQKVLYSTTQDRPDWNVESVQSMERDLNTLEQWISSQFSVSLRNILLVIGGIVLLLHSSLKLTLLFLTLIPALIIPILMLTRRFRKRVKAQKSENDTLTAFFDEHLRALPVLQSLNYEDEAVRQLTSRAHHLQTAQTASLRGRALLIASIMMVIFGGVAFILWIGGHDVIDGTMSKGTLSAFVLYAMMVAGAMGALSDAAEELRRVAHATLRLHNWLALPDHFTPSAIVASVSGTTADTPATIDTTASAFTPVIQFKQITFTYPYRQQPALHAVSLDINAGEHVAIVGASGAGKSTLLQLLLGFYAPDSGEIFIHGTRLTLDNAAPLRRYLAWVSQDPALFTGTIRDNILYGEPDAPEAALHQVCEWSNLSDWVSSLPQGLDTFIGNLNRGVSGGQRQRIAIARAMLANRPILLLDEATSALDAENEHAIQEALQRLCTGRTVLTIAHRLSTVMAADRIILMDQGSIVDMGTHSELLARHSLYARFVSLQTAS